ncbi:MAG: hypothetical protein WBA42_01330 [Mesorhizobium sp.]
MFDWLKIGAGAAMGALVAAGPAYLYGKHEGRQQAAVARLEADVSAHIKREGIDHEVDGMERYRICLDLGGLPNDCGQLRGVDETTEGK